MYDYEFIKLFSDEVMFEDTKQDEVKEQRVERKVDETVAEEDEDDDATVEVHVYTNKEMVYTLQL